MGKNVSKLSGLLQRAYGSVIMAVNVYGIYRYQTLGTDGMPRYYHEHSYHKQTRFLRKVRIVLILLAVIIAVTGAYLIYDSRRSARKSSAPSAPTQETTSVFTAPVEVFSTQYFQFQANRKWTFIASESNATKFTYRYLAGGLIEHELLIFINVGNDRIVPAATRVMPVELGAGDELVPGPVSDSCQKGYAANEQRIERLVTFGGVRFLCDPNSPHYSVVLGTKNGSSLMTLKRQDGSTAVYGVYYRNFKAKPDERPLKEIAKTFKAR